MVNIRMSDQEDLAFHHDETSGSRMYIAYDKFYTARIAFSKKLERVCAAFSRIYDAAK